VFENFLMAASLGEAEGFIRQVVTYGSEEASLLPKHANPQVPLIKLPEKGSLPWYRAAVPNRLTPRSAVLASRESVCPVTAPNKIDHDPLDLLSKRGILESVDHSSYGGPGNTKKMGNVIEELYAAQIGYGTMASVLSISTILIWVSMIKIVFLTIYSNLHNCLTRWFIMSIIMGFGFCGSYWGSLVSQLCCCLNPIGACTRLASVDKRNLGQPLFSKHSTNLGCKERWS